MLATRSLIDSDALRAGERTCKNMKQELQQHDHCHRLELAMQTSNFVLRPERLIIVQIQ